MGAFEYLWVDSKENQEKYKEEKERMFKIIPNHEKFMEEYAKENPGRGDFDALDDEILERGAPNKDSKLLQKNNRDEEYFKDAHEIQAKVEKELDEYNAKEDEERENFRRRRRWKRKRGVEDVKERRRGRSAARLSFLVWMITNIQKYI